MKIAASFDGCYSMKYDIGAGAGVAYTTDGVELGYMVKYIEGATTPIAEYTALINALLLGLRLGATEIVCWGDAELVCRQIQDQKDNPHGVYAVRDPILQQYNALVKLLMARYERADVLELPRAGEKNKRRHNNARADQLAGECRETRLSLTEIHTQPGDTHG